MTDETQAEMPVEDVPLSPETEAADSSPAEEAVTPQADDAGQPRDEDGKFLSKNAQKRIDELTWKANQREREVEYWRQQALNAQKPPPEPAKPVELKVPKLEDFGYDEAAYAAAFVQHLDALAEAKVEKRLAEAEQKKAQEARDKSLVERLKTKPDLAQKVLYEEFFPVSTAMSEVIKDSEMGLELLEWIDNNREQAARIYNLPERQAALELGRIEGRLEALKEAKTRPVVSKAPPPPPRVDDTQTEVEQDPETMSADQWKKWREKQLRKARK